MNKTDVLNEIAHVINYATESEQWRSEHEGVGVCTPFEVVVNLLSMLHLKVYSELGENSEK